MSVIVTTQLDSVLSKAYPLTYIFSEVRGVPPTTRAPNRANLRQPVNASGTRLESRKTLQWTSYFRPNENTTSRVSTTNEANKELVTEENIRNSNAHAIQSLPWSTFPSAKVDMETLTTREETATTPRPLTFDLALLPSDSTSTSSTTLNSAAPTAMAVPSIYHMNAHRNIYSSTNGENSFLDELTLGNRVPIVVSTTKTPTHMRTRQQFTLHSKPSLLVPLGVPGSLVSQIGGVRRPQTSPVRQTKIDKGAQLSPAASTLWPMTTALHTTTPVSARCGGESFECLTASRIKCIKESMVCDGRADCTDGSDESATICRSSVPCGTDEFSCDHGKCHPTTQRCDGREDCDDGTGELHVK